MWYVKPDAMLAVLSRIEHDRRCVILEGLNAANSLKCFFSYDGGQTSMISWLHIDSYDETQPSENSCAAVKTTALVSVENRPVEHNATFIVLLPDCPTPSPFSTKHDISQRLRTGESVRVCPQGAPRKKAHVYIYCGTVFGILPDLELLE